MNPINQILFLLSIVVSFPLGFFLAKYTQEEVKQGKKYFIWLEKILFISIIIVSFVYFFLYQRRFLILPVLLVSLFFFIQKTKYRLLNFSVFILVILFTKGTVIYYLAALTFLYGLILGTILRPLRMSKVNK